MRTKLTTVVVSSLLLAACAGSPELPERPTDGPATGEDPTGPTEWVDGLTESASEGFVADAAGDLILTGLTEEATEDGCLITLTAEGTSELGYRVDFAEVVDDATPHFFVDLSGLAIPHPQRILSSTTDGCPTAGTGMMGDQVSGPTIWIAEPVLYRATQPDPQTLVLEFQATPEDFGGAFGPPVERDQTPPPDPWDGAEFTEDATSGEGAPASDSYNEIWVMSSSRDDEVDTVRVRFHNGDAPSWEAAWVDAAVHPETGEDLGLAGEAVLRLNLPGAGTAPDDTYLDYGVTNDHADVRLTEGEDGGVTLWIARDEVSPYVVALDGAEAVVAFQR